MFDDAFNGKTGSLDWLNLPSRLDIHNVMVPGSRHRFLFRKCLFLDELHVQYAPWSNDRMDPHLKSAEI